MMKEYLNYRIWALMLISFLICTGNIAFAAIPENNALDVAGFDVFYNTAAVWYGTLIVYAYKLFWSLAIIELSWTLIQLALKGGGLQDFIAEIVRRIFFFGFFFAVLTNAWPWAKAIINSFAQASNAAMGGVGTQGVSGSNLFDLGMKIAKAIISETSIWSPGDALGLIISSLIALIIMAYISALVILAYTESYIAMGAGVLFMGFGGSQWTSDIAKKIIMWIFSIGVKIFVLNLIVGLCYSVILNWTNQFNAGKNGQIFVIIGSLIVLAIIAKEIPNYIQSIISGVSIGTGGSSIAGVAKMAGAVGLGAVGGAMAAGAASNLASAQGASGTVAHLKQMAKNLGGAMKEDIAGRASGDRPYGSTTGRMGQSMRARANDLRAQQSSGSTPNIGNISGGGDDNETQPYHSPINNDVEDEDKKD